MDSVPPCALPADVSKISQSGNQAAKVSVRADKILLERIQSSTESGELLFGKCPSALV